ncbi:MAG: XAC2610-related protein [Moheibacter sp.]
MKQFLVLVLSCYFTISFGQSSYEIFGFSEKYKGLLIIEEGYEDEVFKKGEISIIEIKTNRPIIKINSDELTFDFDEKGKVETNISELPYGEQSIIICQDFNFDGIDDLAVMDGQFSCYHGPSFQIYLETKEGLKHSSEFTRLAQEYCGMFTVDNDAEAIYTMTKSGCCWHQYTTFRVENNIPIEYNVFEENLNPNGFMWDYVVKNRKEGRMVEQKYSILIGEADIILVYDLTFKNDKKMEIYRAFDFEDYLFYTFKDKDDKIELFYSDQFVYDKRKNTLTFTNEGVNYLIYNEGILINLPNKQVDLKAIGSSADVSLSSLAGLKLKNLILK